MSRRNIVQLVSRRPTIGYDRARRNVKNDEYIKQPALRRIICIPTSPRTCPDDATHPKYRHGIRRKFTDRRVYCSGNSSTPSDRHISLRFPKEKKKKKQNKTKREKPRIAPLHGTRRSAQPPRRMCGRANSIIERFLRVLPCRGGVQDVRG